MIIYDETTGLIGLHTRHTTYQMKADARGVLLHTYYGPRIGQDDLSRLIRPADRGFSANPADAGGDRRYYLDTLPQEYPCAGGGDMRVPALEVAFADGSAAPDLRFVGLERREGKYALPGLPAFHGEGWETLVVRLADEANGLRAELYYGVAEEHDLITRAVRFVNAGGGPVRLERAMSLCLELPEGDMDLVTFDGAYGMERVPHRGTLRPGVQSVGSVRGASSHQHNPFVVLCRPDTGEDHGLCYGAMLLYSGSFLAEAERDQFDTARLVLGIHPRRFSWTLAPGESFTAPEAALVCSGEGFGPMSRRLHRAIRECLVRDPYAGRRRPVLINSWEAAYFRFDADTLLSMAEAAAALGVELFVLDDGWFGERDCDRRALGDWWVNEKKLPGGLTALAERVRALGMRFGLWIEPEMISEDSDLYRAHPDWALGPAEKPRSRSRDQLVLDFSRADVREHVFQALRAVIDGADVDYIKWDMNRSLTEVWSASLPADRQGEVYHRYVLGVYELLERFRQTWPDMLIEGCAGGGGRFDAGMLYYVPQIWCSDNSDPIDRLFIQGGTSFAYPPSAMAAHVAPVPNALNGRVASLQTRGTVAMAGAFGYELDPRSLTPEERETVRRQVETYKQRWQLVYQGDYYRLTDFFRPGPYVAWAMVSPDRSRALACLVYTQNRAAGPLRTLCLKGLDPEKRYRVDGGGIWGGAALMAAGYPLPPQTGDYDSVTLYLEAVKGG